MLSTINHITVCLSYGILPPQSTLPEQTSSAVDLPVAPTVNSSIVNCSIQLHYSMTAKHERAEELFFMLCTDGNLQALTLMYICATLNTDIILAALPAGLTV